MPTNPQLNKTLSFRISRELWIRIGDVARRLGVTTQVFCTEAIERHLARFENKTSEDVNGAPVRAKIAELKYRKASQTEEK